MTPDTAVPSRQGRPSSLIQPETAYESTPCIERYQSPASIERASPPRRAIVAAVCTCRAAWSDPSPPYRDRAWLIMPRTLSPALAPRRRPSKTFPRPGTSTATPSAHRTAWKTRSALGPSSRSRTRAITGASAVKPRRSTVQSLSSPDAVSRRVDSASRLARVAVTAANDSLARSARSRDPDARRRAVRTRVSRVMTLFLSS